MAANAQTLGRPGPAADRIAARWSACLGMLDFVLVAWLLIGAGLSPQDRAPATFDLARSAAAAGWLAAVCWAYRGLLLWRADIRGVWIGLAAAPLMVLAASIGGTDEQPSAWPLAALTPPQLALQIAEQPDLRVTLPLSTSSWLAYLGHALMLVPLAFVWERTRRRSRAAERAAQAAARAEQELQQRLEAERRRRAETLLLPAAVTTLFVDQPFRILGLRPEEARVRVIMRRRDEMLGLIGAGLDVATELPAYLKVALGPAAILDETVVRRAVARLQHDPDRCLEALLWFHLDADDAAARQALADGRLDAADRAWAESGRATAPYNRAVLALARAIEAEADCAPPHPMRSGAAWRASDACWARVLAEPGCWAGVERLVAQCSDPRIGPDHLARLREELPRRVLDVQREIVSVAIDGGFSAYARAHLDLIEASALPAPAKQAVLDACFAPHVDALRRVVSVLHDPARELTRRPDLAGLERDYDVAGKRLSEIGALARVEPIARETVVSACDRLPRESFGPWRAFLDADRACFEASAALIEAWNAGAGSSAGRIAILRGLRDRMQAHRREVDALGERFGAYEAVVRQLLRAVQVLRRIARDAGTDERTRVDKLADDETKALENAREELRKTKEHFERNLRGMIEALNG